jgi:hypothetical protein
MDSNLLKVIKSYSDLLKNPPKTDKELSAFTKKTTALSYLLTHPLSHLVFAELKSTNFKKKYDKVVNHANHKMEEGFSCSINDHGMLILSGPEKNESVHKLYTPQQLAKTLTADDSLNNEQKTLIEIFVSNESIFVVLNFGLHLK